MSELKPKPVTVCIARRVRAGKEADYENWIKRIVVTASTFPGHMGVDILKPSEKTGGEYVLLIRYDNEQHQIAWEKSEERALFLQELGDLVEGEKVSKVSGLELWFSLPDVPVAAAPSQHKMALVLCVVVFLLVYLVNLIFGAYLAELSLVLRVALLSIVQVVLLTYVVMPRVTGLLKNWLYNSKR